MLPGIRFIYDMVKRLGTLYRYESLDYSVHDFRLLRLSRGSGQEDISCGLYHSSFKDAPPYEALSYTWGNPELVDTIIVNEKTLRVTESLLTAMQYLRHRDRDRLFWIAVIKENNKTERGHQVQKMREIYLRAGREQIWLGTATVEIDILIKRLARFERWMCKHVGNLATTSSEGTEASSSSMCIKRKRKDRTPMPSTINRRYAAPAFSSRSHTAPTTGEDGRDYESHTFRDSIRRRRSNDYYGSADSIPEALVPQSVDPSGSF